MKMLASRTAKCGFSGRAKKLMNTLNKNSITFGAPGIELRWTSSAIVFTLLRQEGWGGKDFQVGIAALNQTQKTV